MTKLDEETLMAYVDGELDPGRAAEIEALLAEDPEARATVKIFRDSAAVLRGAFDPILREPVPERLLRAVEAPPTGKVHDIRLARRGVLSRFLPQTAWARAAAVALLVGAGAAYLTARWWPSTLESKAWVTIADPLLNEALEITASGSVFARQESDARIGREILPLLTFRDEGGRFCREFESSLTVPDGRQVSYGVACREHGAWHAQVLMARQLIAPTLGGDPSADPSQYVPAMGGEVAGFDAIIEQLMIDGPLSPEEEAALIDSSWR